MTLTRSWSAGLLAVLALVLQPSLHEGQRAADPPGPYVLTDLGTLGTVQSAHARAINDAGTVVGLAGNRAFRWQDGVMTDLGTLGGTSSVAEAINDLGQIAGRSALSGSSSHHATLWDTGAPPIDLTPTVSYSTATAINDAREVVGTIDNWTAFLWRDGVLTMLDHLGGGGSFAADINNAGQIVGTSYSTHVTELGPMQHPFVWQNGVMTDLGLLPGDEDGGAAGINDAGQIVGSSGRTDPETYATNYRAFLYDNGVMTALPVPSWDSYAGDINDAGVIVGSMRAAGGSSNYHAFVYADGVAYNLNSLIPSGSGLHLAYANAVNNAGQIVGVAFDAQARYHAFLLTPVDPNTPVVNIGDASVTEGHSGTRAATFTLTLSRSSTEPVTVSYATSNGTALAGSDYQSAAGTATFAAGQTTQTIAVLVNGDRAGEPNETFLLTLSQATGGGLIADGQGTGTIVDDEPRLSIGSVSLNEGNSGTTPFTFTVTLSPASDVAVSVGYATANGSARSPEDYDAKSGSITFAAGQTSRTITVNVKGDRKLEGQEVFYVNLSNAAAAFISGGQGTGVIRIDDR